MTAVDCFLDIASPTGDRVVLRPLPDCDRAELAVTGRGRNRRGQRRTARIVIGGAEAIQLRAALGHLVRQEGSGS